MENATKAFIIAGGMLIAMMIVGLLVWGFGLLSRNQKEKVMSESIEQITEFNLKFEAYNKGSVRGYQMISLANLAEDINKRYRPEEGYQKVDIIAKMKSPNNLPGVENAKIYLGSSNYYDMIDYVNNVYSNFTDPNKKNAFKQLYFQCTKVIYDNEYDPITNKTGTGIGRVKRMEFEQVEVSYSR